MAWRPLCVLIVASGVVACGAHKPGSAAPTSAAVVQIPNATPDQLKAFDSDKSALPPARTDVATAAKPRARGHYVDVDDPWRSPQMIPIPRGGPDCIAAALCCERYRRTTRTSSVSSSVCAGVRHFPDNVCLQLLEAFRRAAAHSGFSCP